jgi:hypothetical protein
MKNLENILLLKICIEKPITIFIVLLVSVSSFIYVDQRFFAHKEVVSSVAKELEPSEINDFSSTYVGWLPTSPDLIRSYRDLYPNVDARSALISFDNIRSAVSRGLDFLEFQFRLSKRFIQIIINRG